MKPEISIIIPVGQGRKIKALESLKRQKFPIEIIVERGPNPSKNRNNGIKKAKAPLIAFINAHTILSEDWAEKVTELFSKYPMIDVVGGPQLNHKSEGFFAKSSGYAFGSVFGAGNLRSRYNQRKINFNADETMITSANLICKKKVLKKIKFDESLYPGEDPKFISDCKSNGFKVVYSPDIISYNLRRTTLTTLAKQIYSYGYTRTKKESLAETLNHPIFLIPSLFLIYLVLLPTLFLLSVWFVAPLILYLTLDLFFSIYEAVKNRSILSIFLLPILFPTIHLSYGLGFIYGLLTKK